MGQNRFAARGVSCRDELNNGVGFAGRGLSEGMPILNCCRKDLVDFQFSCRTTLDVSDRLRLSQSDTLLFRYWKLLG